MRLAARRWGILLRKGFVQNFQYSASHLVQTAASVVFGLIYISMWLAVTPAEGFGPYTPAVMVQYICFNQVIAWFTQFGMRVRQGVAESVRSGKIAVELARPMDFFFQKIAFEFGAQLYGLVFRGLPVGLGLALLVDMRLPASPAVWLSTLTAVAIGGYIGLTLGYMVGISSFWTNEIRTVSWALYSAQTLLGGISMPLEVLPGGIGALAKALPFAHLAYYPARIYLGLSGPAPIMAGLSWAIALTIMARALTNRARRRLEVQGG